MVSLDAAHKGVTSYRISACHAVTMPIHFIMGCCPIKNYLAPRVCVCVCVCGCVFVFATVSATFSVSVFVFTVPICVYVSVSLCFLRF